MGDGNSALDMDPRVKPEGDSRETFGAPPANPVMRGLDPRISGRCALAVAPTPIEMPASSAGMTSVSY